MNRIISLLRSVSRLLKLVGREFILAAISFSTGKYREARAHTRSALQVLHEDLASIAGLRGVSVAGQAVEDVSRVLIVKLDRIGDMVNTTPVFDVLRAQYPNAKLDLCGHPAVLTLLEGDSRIDRRFAFSSALYHEAPIRIPSFGDWKMIRQLWRAQYPIIVYLRGSFPFLLLALRSPFFSSKFVEGEPVICRYLRAIGHIPRENGLFLAPSLNVTTTSRRRVSEMYPRRHGRQRVIVHAVSAAEGKQWPLERFAKVADELVTRMSVDVIFLATPSEITKLEEIRSLCSQWHRFVTELSLPEVVAAIADADLFIGNDSGLAHIAAAVGTYGVVIWGAANLNMARPIAPPENCSILYREVSCRATCNEERCTSADYIKCLRMIDESEVVDAAISLLQKNQPQVLS